MRRVPILIPYIIKLYFVADSKWITCLRHTPWFSVRNNFAVENSRDTRNQIHKRYCFSVCVGAQPVSWQETFDFTWPHNMDHMSEQFNWFVNIALLKISMSETFLCVVNDGKFIMVYKEAFLKSKISNVNNFEIMCEKEQTI